MIFKSRLLIFIFIFFSNFSFAQIDEKIENKVLEDRAQLLFKELRCMVCQNQSIDDSNAPLAKDLRILIREQIKNGHSDKEIYKFLTDRYGDFILLKPPFKIATFALWFLTLVFLIIGVFIIINHNRNIKKHLKE